MRHLAKPHCFTTIWLTFRHAQKRGGGICQIHLCLCQLLSTCGNICSRVSLPRSILRLGVSSAARPLLCDVSRVFRDEEKVLTWTEVNPGMWKMKCKSVCRWRNVDTDQITGDTEASCVPLLTAPKSSGFINNAAGFHLETRVFKPCVRRIVFFFIHSFMFHVMFT